MSEDGFNLVTTTSRGCFSETRDPISTPWTGGSLGGLIKCALETDLGTGSSLLGCLLDLGDDLLVVVDEFLCPFRGRALDRHGW